MHPAKVELSVKFWFVCVKIDLSVSRYNNYVPGLFVFLLTVFGIHFKYIYLALLLWVCIMCVCVGAGRGPLAMVHMWSSEDFMVYSFSIPMRVLGLEPRSSRLYSKCFTCWAVLPALRYCLLWTKLTYFFFKGKCFKFYVKYSFSWPVV